MAELEGERGKHLADMDRTKIQIGETRLQILQLRTSSRASRERTAGHPDPALRSGGAPAGLSRTPGAH